MEHTSQKLSTCSRNRILGTAAFVLAVAFMMVASGSTRAGQLPAATSSGTTLSLAKAEALQVKMQELSASSGRRSSALPPVVITDAEVNSYLKYFGSQFLPKGVSGTRLHIMPAGIYGTALVNFDQLQLGSNQEDMGSTLISLMFKGTQRVTAFGSLESGSGKANLKIEDVRIGTTQLNDWLVNWLLQYYVQSKFKIDLSKPLPLPAHVSRIDLRSGQAILVRSDSGR